MKEYFLLQIKLFARKIKAFGINPIAGSIFLAIAFIGVSIILFDKFELAGYIYISISLVIILPFSEVKRNDFLKFHFTDKYRKVRLLENGFLTLPFIAFLLLKSLIIPATLNLILAIVFAFIKTGSRFNFVIPTPFSKTPFEFSTGFRKSFFIVVIAYLLVLAGILVPNFNIGIFAILLLFIVSLTFYVEPENEYFVWSYNNSPKQFLLLKIKTALIHFTLIMLPVLLTLSIYFSEYVYLLTIFLLVGYFVLSTVIVAKYSSYPEKMSISQGVILILSIQLPPLLLVAFPYFFINSVRKLKAYLG